METTPTTTPAAPKKEALATKPPAKFAPWQEALMRAEIKFLAITGKEKEAKIEMGFALMAIEANPDLKKCDPATIVNSVINIARTGSTLNPLLKLAYLIPRKGKCVMDFSYIGKIKVLKDNGCIKDIQVIIVYEDETFEESNSPIIAPIHKKHYAKTEEEQLKREYKGVYSQVLLPDNTVIYTQFTPYWEILKSEKASPGSSSSYSPWQRKNWREDMIKKSKVHKDFKMLISGSPNEKVLAAFEVEEENNGVDFTKTPKQAPAPVTSDKMKEIFGEEEAQVISETKEFKSPEGDFMDGVQPIASEPIVDSASTDEQPNDIPEHERADNPVNITEKAKAKKAAKAEVKASEVKKYEGDAPKQDGKLNL